MLLHESEIQARRIAIRDAVWKAAAIAARSIEAHRRGVQFTLCCVLQIEITPAHSALSSESSTPYRNEARPTCQLSTEWIEGKGAGLGTFLDGLGAFHIVFIGLFVKKQKSDTFAQILGRLAETALMLQRTPRNSLYKSEHAQKICAVTSCAFLYNAGPVDIVQQSAGRVKGGRTG